MFRCVRAAGIKVLHLTYNLHGKGSVVRGDARDGGNDEAGMLANTIPSGETERKGTMHAREGKAKKICLGRRKKEGKKKRGGLRDKRRAVPLCPIEGPIVGELPHVFVLIAVRRRQKSCDSINEMTFVRPSLVAPPSLSGSHKSPHWAPSVLLPQCTRGSILGT